MKPFTNEVIHTVSPCYLETILISLQAKVHFSAIMHSPGLSMHHKDTFMRYQKLLMRYQKLLMRCHKLLMNQNLHNVHSIKS